MKHAENGGNEELCHDSCDQKAANDRPPERCILLAPFPQRKRHRDHAQRQFRLKALAKETREKPPDKPVFEMYLDHVRGIAAVAHDRRLERDRPNGHRHF